MKSVPGSTVDCFSDLGSNHGPTLAASGDVYFGPRLCENSCRDSFWGSPDITRVAIVNPGASNEVAIFRELSFSEFSHSLCRKATAEVWVELWVKSNSFTRLI